jgi:hypothetical protein
MSEEPIVKRDEGGRFLPGASTPSPGRPRALSHADKLRLLLEPEREALIGDLLKLTKSENQFVAVNALRICFERLAPAPKNEAEKVEVRALANAVTLHDKCEAIISAVAAGEISAEAGERLLRMIDVYRKAAALDDIERKLDAILKGKGAVLIPSAPVDDLSDIL